MEVFWQSLSCLHRSNDATGAFVEHFWSFLGVSHIAPNESHPDMELLWSFCGTFLEVFWHAVAQTGRHRLHAVISSFRIHLNSV